ncbi:NAD(P)-binding domain-containing protein [uncultured Ruegeria sp.]|uniref:NAD(P)-binding domain-containing protein n=1 Tax=uncultured Ruegeria sp. TaxID=259304 RepID=UPI00261846E3|nr:NAD(P)-binding domain-containing protein [uncultured Ruegeria sp.]
MGAAKGAGMVDAPLGRTSTHAKDGLLNIMAAGDIDTFEKVKPVLDVPGENVFHLGELGAGHVTKLINNFMGMTTACTMSQAFAVADRAGITSNNYSTSCQLVRPVRHSWGFARITRWMA